MVYSGLVTSLQRANLIAYWLVIEHSSRPNSSNFDLSGVATVASIVPRLESSNFSDLNS